MSEDKKPEPKKGRPSEGAIKNALGARAALARVDGNKVSIVYPSLDAYSAAVSADVEALRKLGEIAWSEAEAFDPSKPVHANSMPIEANMPNSAGAQRVVVAFA